MSACGKQVDRNPCLVYIWHQFDFRSFLYQLVQVYDVICLSYGVRFRCASVCVGCYTNCNSKLTLGTSKNEAELNDEFMNRILCCFSSCMTFFLFFVALIRSFCVQCHAVSLIAFPQKDRQFSTSVRSAIKVNIVECLCKM